MAFTLIYSFHMPLFAFISGYVMRLAQRKSVRTQIIRRAQNLLVPFFAWVVLRYFVPLGSQGTSSNSLDGVLLDALLGREGLWFLYALFICLTVLIWLARAPRSQWLLPASAFIAALCAFSFRIPDVFNLANVLWIYPFCVLGYMVEPLEAKVLKYRWPVAAVCGAAFLPLLYVGNPLSVSTAIPAIPLMNVRLPGLGVLGGLLQYVCAATAVVALYAAYVGRSGRAINAQAWLGRKSLGVYAMHSTVIRLFVRMGVTNVPALIVLSLGVAVLLTALLERIPVVSSLLLGQRHVRPRAQPSL